MATIESHNPSGAEASLPPVPTLGQVARFYGLTFALSWVLFLPLVLHVVSPESAAGVLLVVGAVVAPTIVAFVVSALVAGRDGVRRLRRQATRWRVGAGWYAVVLAGDGLVYGAALAVAAALGGQMPSMNLWVPEVWVAAAISGLLAGTLEEFGWSGLAFPALQARYGLVWAGAAVGIALAVWHIPFFFIPGLPQYTASFELFLLAAIPVRIVFGWIYNGAAGSILLMILFHGSLNAWAEILSLGASSAAETGMLWAAALLVLLVHRGPGPREAACLASREQRSSWRAM